MNAVVSCPRIARFPPGMPLPEGVKPGACSQCAEPVYTSPSTRRLAATGVTVLCRECVLALPGHADHVGVMLPDAVEELRRYAQIPRPEAN